MCAKNTEKLISLEERKEQIHRQALIRKALETDNDLVEARFLGVGRLLAFDNSTVTCLVVGQQEETGSSKGLPPPGGKARPCLFVPIPNNLEQAALKAIECARNDEKLSRVRLLNLNLVFLNRDNGLFDNLPWASWTMDPTRKMFRDAAGNAVDPKFHMGKREAYNALLLGKDWKKEIRKADSGNSTLQSRILEMEIKEAQMIVAEFDSMIAVARQTDDPSELDRLEGQKREAVKKVKDLQKRTNESTSVNKGFFDLISERRGQDSSFASPFHHFQHVIKEKLNAEIIGTIIEKGNMISGSTTAGGALILRRKMTTRTISVGSESFTVEDTAENYGNDGVTGDTTYVVECDVDEAVGFSIVNDIPLQIETDLWESGTIMARESNRSSASFRLFEACDAELSLLFEGQRKGDTLTERAAPIRIPSSSLTFFDSVLGKAPRTEKSRKDLFPTDNPIKSLSQYDKLTNEDKAATLLGLSNFDGRLPRPRTVRTSKGRNPLDELLLNLVDEVVRRQYMIREALAQGDTDLARQLEEAKSARHKLLDRASLADDDTATQEKLELYESLRADVTQDEGSYSRFLDRDEWYERERQKTAKRVNKKQFGTLLDGIE